jgi:acyl-CoA synthetase (AMP-forming)/AMP-acid ligase II
VNADTIVDLVRARAMTRPDDRAYAFLTDGEEEGPRLTYAELDREARKVGGLLQQGLVKEGDRVLLLYPAGLEFVVAFYGSLYAGVIPIPAPPPRPNKPLERLRSIASNADASVVLTTTSFVGFEEKCRDQAPGLRRLRWLATDTLDDELSDRFRPPGVKGERLALLQYTSGSTASPKGVMITHENVLHNCAQLDATLCHTEDTVFVTWLPHFHDMGLIYGIVEPLYTGFPAYILPSVYFLQRPVRWLRAIARYRGTHSAAPNFAYDLCVRKVTPEQAALLDLSSWRMAANAAEPVSARVIEQFSRAFEASGFRRSVFSPCYGLAEATLMVTGVLRDEETPFLEVDAAALGQNRIVESHPPERSTRTLVSCGRTNSGTELVIADPVAGTRCKDLELGEVWVRGPGISEGYWGQPDESERTLHARLADTGEGSFLRTGDLGFVKDRELYIAGRIKDLIIIDGNNHHPQDIEESVARSHPAIRPSCCAAFSIESEGKESLAVVAEIEPRYRRARDGSAAAAAAPGRRPVVEPSEVISAIRRAVAEEHEISARWIELINAGSLPKQPACSIRERRCDRALDGRPERRLLRVGPEAVDGA